jgi:hypothetical protein
VKNNQEVRAVWIVPWESCLAQAAIPGVHFCMGLNFSIVYNMTNDENQPEQKKRQYEVHRNLVIVKGMSCFEHVDH